MASRIATNFIHYDNGFITTNRFYGTQNQQQGGYDVPDNITSNSDRLFNPKNNFIYAMNDIFHREDERLKTFDRWPLEWMDKFQLAQTGMFFTGEGDKVKCYFCEVEIGRWEHEDQPVSEHLRFSPNCPLLRRHATNNVPISSETLDRILPPVSFDECGSNGVPDSRRHVRETESSLNVANYEATSINATTNNTIAAVAATTATAAATTICTNSMSRKAHPEYSTKEDRLSSFAEWPRMMKQKPEILAEAGFFYTGSGDRVKCFTCGGGLKDWDENDDPWEQHALWLSKCPYLKLMEKKKEEVVVAVTPNEATAATEEEPRLAAEEEQQEITTVMSVAPSVDVAPELPASSNNSNSNNNSSNSNSKNIPEEKLCKICYAEEYNTAFLPCGHVVACAMCASSVMKCPLCRKPFTDIMRVYFS